MKIRLITTIFILFFITAGLTDSLLANHPDFFLADNGVTIICEDAVTGDFGEVNGITYTKRDRAGIDALLDADANNPELATTCTSGVTEMADLFFFNGMFNQDISSWDVSSVTTMVNMFAFAGAFNQDIGHWDTGSITTMSTMFRNAGAFNQDIGDWDVSNVAIMANMFFGAGTFNQDISKWEVDNVTNMGSMFRNAGSFNQNLSFWCVEQIASEPQDFDDGADAWTLPNSRPLWGTCPVFFLAENGVTITCEDATIGESGLVNGITYTRRDRAGLDALLNADENNPELATTCTSGITHLSNLFQNNSNFDQDIGSWDVSNVSNMNFMFREAESFNQDIGAWDVGNVTSMRYMFSGASTFNQNIGDWCSASLRNWTQILL